MQCNRNSTAMSHNGETSNDSDSSSDTLPNSSGSRTPPSPNMLECQPQLAITPSPDIIAYYPSSVLGHHGIRPRVSLQSTISERTLVDADSVKTLPSKLLQSAGIFDGEPNHRLYIHFGDFSALWQDWMKKGCIGFIKKVRHLVPSALSILIRRDILA